MNFFANFSLITLLSGILMATLPCQLLAQNRPEVAGGIKQRDTSAIVKSIVSLVKDSANVGKIVRALANDSASVAKVINAISYGVPSSPAFELLPGKTSEVVNLITPQDYASNISNLFDGKKLRTGAAFDIRPFVKLAGSLTNYQKNPLGRVAWRTQLSLGTAPDETIKSDVFLSGGLRIPIIDKGDPRMHYELLDSLTSFVLTHLPPFDFNLTDEQNAERALKATTKGLDSIRTAFFKTNWNRPKLDAGFAYMVRAKSGALSGDSLNSDKYGIWLAGGLPLWQFGQITISGKILRSLNTSKLEIETGRNTLGARARIFPIGNLADRLALSLEFANIWATYQMEGQNESWRHCAVLVEYHLPLLKGWLGVAYGGDTPHRTSPGNKFSLSYAVYTNQLIKR